MKHDNPWVSWALELQNLSQCALAYCKDVYDIERFERIRDISAEMLAQLGDAPVHIVKDLFCGESGYQTPKIETRAAVIRDARILMVQESDGRWALPGGWVDYDISVGTNVVKEVREEAGMSVEPLRLIALQDRNRHHAKHTVHEICSVFVLCQWLSGEFTPNAETIACDWFAPDALPPLAEAKTTPEQIDMCFKAAADPLWQAIIE